MSALALERSHTLREVSDMTGIPFSTLERRARRGDIRTFRLPGCVRGRRVTESELRRWMGGRDVEHG